MRHVTWCVVVMSFFWSFVEALEVKCDYDYPEKQLLNNIEKLLNQPKLRLVEGVILRKKSEDSYLVTQSNGTTCENPLDVVLRKVSTTLNTHVLEFDLTSIFKDTAEAETPRRRRHQQQAISMMLLGITIFLMVFVPMGFQFLAALGGKAFLMAKLALLLASVNGLKRVATSGVHYGLYQTNPEPSFPHQQYAYDRYDRPRMS